MPEQYIAEFTTADGDEIEVFNQESGIILSAGSLNELTPNETDILIGHLTQAKARHLLAKQEARLGGVTAQMILDLPMVPGENDARASSVRDYLRKLTELVWREDEAFNGKRPFGNSGWTHELMEVLVKAGFAEDTYDEKAFDIIVLAISGL